MPEMIKKLSLIVLLTAVAFIVSSQAQAEKHVRAAIASLPSGNGDPFYTTLSSTIVALSAVFDGLARIDSNGDVHPALATHWELEGDKTWTYHLRKDIRFSNGEAFNAAAVVNALEYLTSEEGALTGVGRELIAVDGFRALDDFTVEIKTKAPFPILPRAMASVRIPAPGHWQSIGPQAFSLDPVGTGPLKVENWSTRGVSFTAFKESWRAPIIDSLEFLALPDKASRIQALLSDAVDIAFSVSADDEEVLLAAGATLHSALYASVMVISLQTGPGTPLNNSDVRRALNYAVNKQVMIDALMGGAGSIASQPVPPQSPGYDSDLKPYPYDPDKARQLLAQAGLADGFDLTIEVIPGQGSNVDAMYEMVASDLRQIGVNVTLLGVPRATLVGRIFSGDWVGQGFGMSMDTVPTLDALRPFRTHSCLWPQPWHCNEADTPLLRAADQEMNLDKRNAIIQELLRRYHNDPPAIYMLQVPAFVGLSKRIRNYQNDHGVVHYDKIDLVQ